MYLLTEEQQVNLEVLDNRQIPICTIPVKLLSLHGEWAEVLVSAEENPSGLRWGAWVRFWVGEGSESFEVTGAVSALELQRENLANDSSTTQISRSREVLIRLQEFRPVSQRRTAARHFHQTKIMFQSFSKEEYLSADLHKSEPSKDQSDSSWISAMCIDVGPGGMRIRTDSATPENEHLILYLTFPKRSIDSGTQKCQFLLPGRVIRRTPGIRNSSAVEIAVKFDNLSVEDGIALSSWISR